MKRTTRPELTLTPTGAPLRDIPLIVEDLLGQADDASHAGGPSAVGDDLLALTAELLAQRQPPRPSDVGW